MRKIFLIPLLTLMCSVMAWGANVAKVGDVEYSTLQAALDAADPGATVELLANISADKKYSITKNVRLKGNSYTLSNAQLLINADDITITLDGLTLSGNKHAVMLDYHKNITFELADGTNNTITTSSTSHDCFMGYNGGDESLLITGNGTLNVSAGRRAFQVSNLVVNAPNVYAKGLGNMTYRVIHSVEINAGRYSDNPFAEIGVGKIVAKVNENEKEWYQVIDLPVGVKAYNATTCVTYTAFDNVISDANDGDKILVFEDNNFASVAKNLVIEAASGVTVSATAGAGYQMIENAGKIVISNNALVQYLTGSTSDNYNVEADVDLTSVGQIIIKGNKTLTIADGVTVTCKYQTDGYSFVVPNGAKLTLKGNGTLSGDCSMIMVEKGGELVIGEESKASQLKLRTTFNAYRNEILHNNGIATIYNADMLAESSVIRSFGELNIDGGNYEGHANTKVDYGYAILVSGGKMHMNNAIVKGVQGGVSPESGSYAEINNSELYTIEVSGADKGYYPLYVCTMATAIVKDTKIHGIRGKQNGTTGTPGNVVYMGNNDYFNSYGLIFLYDGCMLNGKAYMGAVPANAQFPVSVSEDSEWRKVSTGARNIPLPAGYEYKDIIASGEPTASQILDAEAYNAGYRFKVVSKASKTEDATGTTIPWQQNTTWTDTQVDHVPSATTAVTIPEGKTVVVSKDETNKNAVAEQLHIGSGASLTVQEGTTLAIGEGGINIADGGQLIVEDQAIVTVGEAGIVTANENAIVIKSDATGTGAFLIHPDVTENTRPAATVQMYAKAHKVGENWFPQHCGIPTVGAPESITFPAGGSTYMDKFVADGATPWEAVTSISNLEPFVGYRLNFSGENEAGVYTFKGNLQGNGDAPLQFVKPYYNLLANSYTSPMDIKALFDGLTTQYEDNVDLTLWVYNSSNNRHEVVSKADITNQETDFTTIAPMQGYILYCGPTQAQAGSIDYQSAIWECAKKIGVPILAPARNVNDGRVRATIVVSSPTSSDKVVLREADNYSNAFENGADARKYMSENVFNIYSTNNGEAFSQIATDNLMGTAITVKAANETAYILSFSNVQNFNYAIRDNLSGAIIPVEEGMSYEFTMNEGATAEGRFEVVERYNTPTGVENVEAARSAKGIYTVLGQYIGESSLLNTLPTGIYVVDGQRIVK